MSHKTQVLKGFFPDFIVGIKERRHQDGGLLADTKYAYETTREIPKLLAEHKAYGRVLILTKNTALRWAIAELDSRGKPRIAPPSWPFSAACPSSSPSPTTSPHQGSFRSESSSC